MMYNSVIISQLVPFEVLYNGAAQLGFISVQVNTSEENFDLLKIALEPLDTEAAEIPFHPHQCYQIVYGQTCLIGSFIPGDPSGVPTFLITKQNTVPVDWKEEGF